MLELVEEEFKENETEMYSNKKRQIIDMDSEE